MERLILTLTCEDRPGVVATVASGILQCGGNIVEANQFEERVNHVFFMRVVFDVDPNKFDRRLFLERTKASEALRNPRIKLKREDEKVRVLILVSKIDHCLADLIYKSRIGELDMNIVAVVSNHPEDKLNVSLNLRSDYAIPFYHLPITRETKAQQESELREIISSTGAELLVLARYMQILSNDFADEHATNCINIHHSFLPSFVGAKPYHQAYDRGVKMIGATAHYVTSELDEGPIIVQDVENVSHSDSPERLIRKGREIERRVLSRAVKLHLEDRVIIDGNRTVVFDR